ncbi:putative transmembrane protein [Toxoplasma gondii MAS]|uniref:Putative transmembrane protein n=2 Tax=Toxoplasma gondii TaxID=5811 RepID=A0A2G8Y7W4_TOXGO|nr:putative transmembrane protein [Toxoplasma gondii MAS]PIM03354.1 putative transmembrane protein [Toxoplasma gondii COUG]
MPVFAHRSTRSLSLEFPVARSQYSPQTWPPLHHTGFDFCAAARTFTAVDASIHTASRVWFLLGQSTQKGLFCGRFSACVFSAADSTMSCDEVIRRTTSLAVPTPPSQNEKLSYILLGILNCFLFGVGMIVLGAMKNDTPDVLIGVFQLVIPFVGWVWAVIWGVLIVLKALK